MDAIGHVRQHFDVTKFLSHSFLCPTRVMTKAPSWHIPDTSRTPDDAIHTPGAAVAWGVPRAARLGSWKTISLPNRYGQVRKYIITCLRYPWLNSKQDTRGCHCWSNPLHQCEIGKWLLCCQYSSNWPIFSLHFTLAYVLCALLLTWHWQIKSNSAACLPFCNGITAMLQCPPSAKRPFDFFFFF